MDPTQEGPRIGDEVAFFALSLQSSSLCRMICELGWRSNIEHLLLLFRWWRAGSLRGS